jgi:serine/threonine protein phosphatase PrpC
LTKYIPEIESGGLSEIGTVREDNQDSIYLPDGLYAPEMGLLYAVADGMGGYTHGSVASSLALESLVDTLFDRDAPSPRALLSGIEKANLEVYKAAQRLSAGRMGTTLTAAYILDDMLHLAHVGDSRAYLIRDGQVVCLTADHTTVGDMVRSKLISADKIRTHAQRSVLTRAIGLGLFVQPDIDKYKLHEGDRLVLCTDGVWSVIDDQEFAQVAKESSAEESSQNLIDLALSRETDDNVSVVVFHLRKLTPVLSEPEPEQKMSWFQKLRKLAR